MSWVIKHDGNVAPHVVSYPGNTEPNPPSFVKVSAGGDSVVLATTVRRGAGLEQLFVAPGRFATVPDGEGCTAEQATERAFKIYWLFRDPARQRALIGLVIAVVGVVLTAGAEVGKSYPVFVIGTLGMTIFSLLGYALAVFGLWLTFDGAYSSTD